MPTQNSMALERSGGRYVEDEKGKGDTHHIHVIVVHDDMHSSNKTGIRDDKLEQKKWLYCLR